MWGLGGVDKRRLVRAALQKCKPNIVVIQEMKKEEVFGRLVRWTLGPKLSNWCVVLLWVQPVEFCVLGTQ